MEATVAKKPTSVDLESRYLKLKRKPMFDERGTIMNGVKLSFEKGFGFCQNQAIHSTAHCIDDNKLVYILAKQIVLYDMLTETQQVIEWIGQEEEITCFRYFKNLMLDNNLLFAYRSQNKSYPSVIIKNFSKNCLQKYILTHLEKDERILMLELVNDFRHICVISSLEGAFRLTVVDVVSKQVYGNESLDFKVNGLVVPQTDSKTMLLFNERDVYIVDFNPELKPVCIHLDQFLAADEAIVDLTHSFSHELSLYLITDKGNFYIFYISQHNITKFEVRFLGTYETVNQQGVIVTKPKHPSSICCNEYHILIGYYHVEQFTIFKASGLNTGCLHETIRFSCPFLHKIVKMSFAHETMAVCIVVQVKENDKLGLSIPIQSDYLREKDQVKQAHQSLSNHLLAPGKIFPVIFNLLLHDTLAETLRSPIQSIITSTLFIKKILDIAVLSTKKLILILSDERKIKAISFEHISSTSFERMLEWETSFNPADNPLSLDVHPLTFFVAVGLREGLKLFVISTEGLKSSNIQFPLKNCESVRYSKFGHKLIAGSLNQIIVINPYENRIINTIQLGSGYAVKELSFLDKDLFIYSLCSNGSSSVLSSQGNKVFEVWNKKSKCLCSAYDSVFDVTIVSYAESLTEFYRNRGSQEYASMWTSPFNITKILILNELGTVFMGTSTGNIRAYQWPFVDMRRFKNSYTEIQLHSSAITEIRVTHGYNFIVTGAEDGSVFISRINAYSEGIISSDTEILSSLRTNCKSFKTLYYLQNYANISSSIENSQDEAQAQLQSDKADFDAEYNQIILHMQGAIDQKLKIQENKISQDLRTELLPLEMEIGALNAKKNTIREKIAQEKTNLQLEETSLQQKKLDVMRGQYKDTDALQIQRSLLIESNSKAIQILQAAHGAELAKKLAFYRSKQMSLAKECDQMKDGCRQNLIDYDALMKEDSIQGKIYKQRMLEELEQALIDAKEKGEMLRKDFNKTDHDINTSEEKLKYFQQLSTQLQIDLENAESRKIGLKQQMSQLAKFLSQKDKTISDEESAVKQLLSNNINKYTHEQYLKHCKQELLDTAKYLTLQIIELDKKYNGFQEDFARASAQAKSCDSKIEEAISKIALLKKKTEEIQQISYIRRYRYHELYSKVLESFKSAEDHSVFSDCVNDLLLAIDNVVPETKQSFEEAVGKRDHLIKKVVNENNLRKIDDQIRKTIMIKLNRETVSLTCEVNELRKEKKNLFSKVRELKHCIKENSPTCKQNFNDIVPGNISIIQGKKNPSVHKLLPFQLYHHNKSNSRASLSKGLDESSTQLPSLLKNSSQSYESYLHGVEEEEDEVAL